ncbi:MAG: phytanoyl-CoA dioxygenase family protein [Planctomycetes bacterium]|nr:phytanoyl-CoA dioxygenase family protein [Planctomycetota bacterium]
MMTQPEIYEFDLNGVIIYRNLIAPDRLREMNRIIDAKIDPKVEFGFDFLGYDPIFFELMEHPRTLDILRTMIGEWFRLDHAYGIQLAKDNPARDNVHGGPRTDHGEHQYQWHAGKMYNGLVVVMYALEDVNPGDGGFHCLPGSHKSNLDWHPDHTSPLVVQPSLKAGDMLIFTEALVHGTRKWVSPNRRRSLLYKYSPGHSTWTETDWCDKYRPMATTEMQRALMRTPSVGTRKPLPFAPVPPVNA